MPWERSPDGLIKHLVHQKMHTRECCIEAYMQFLKDGERSGKHRHMWEELFFVVEGSGYDLHWDLKWDCLEAFDWQWAEAPKKFEWTVGDYVYIPPFTMHQHFANAGQECRIIVMSTVSSKTWALTGTTRSSARRDFDATTRSRQFSIVVSTMTGLPSRTTAIPARPARFSQDSAGLANVHSSSPGCIAALIASH